jgi:hypothetical protein
VKILLGILTSSILSKVIQPTCPLLLYAGVTDLHGTLYCDRYTEIQRTVAQ